MGKLLKTYLTPHPPIMVQEVGKGSEIEVQDTINSMNKVAQEIKELAPGTIVIVVPPHGPAFGDAMSINTDAILYGDMGNFGAANVSFKLQTDMKLCDIIMRKSAGNNIPIAPIDEESSKRYRISNNLDHGSMVPLYFVNKKYKDYKIVHITYGILSNEELYHFGRIIRESIEEGEENAVIICSGDLSHRLTKEAPAGYSPLGKQYDSMLIGLLERPEVDKIMEMDRDLIDAAGECAYRSILVMLGCFDGIDAEGTIMSYEGPYGVGYSVASYNIGSTNKNKEKVSFYYENKINKMKEIRSSEDEYVRLARESLESYIRTGKKIDVPDNISRELLNKRGGTFVSIKKGGQLRGCIGTIEGVHQNIAREIIENAISVGTRDPRFYEVDEEELDELVYSVDVLGETEPIESSDDLDPKRYGVIVTKGSRSGLLLPNLEGVDTVDEQLKIVLKKAGINENEDYEIERFEVIRHK